MGEKRLLFIRILLFLGMVLCFSLQSLDNFQKYLKKQTSISESDVMKPTEPLPTFSICSEPSFDSLFLKQNDISPNLFLGSFRLSFLNDKYQFPNYLNSDVTSGISLQNFWTASALRPQIFNIGGDQVQLDKYPHTNEENNTEIKTFEFMNSLYFGWCTSFVLKKERDTNKMILLGFEYPR